MRRKSLYAQGWSDSSWKDSISTRACIQPFHSSETSRGRKTVFSLYCGDPGIALAEDPDDLKARVAVEAGLFLPAEFWPRVWPLFRKENALRAATVPSPVTSPVMLRRFPALGKS